VFQLGVLQPLASTYNISTGTFTPITLKFQRQGSGRIGHQQRTPGNRGVLRPKQRPATQLGFLDIGGTFYSLDDPNSNGFTVPNGINNMDEIVGDYQAATGPIHGSIYNLSSNTWQTIDDPNASSASATFVTGINDMGDLAGYY
jgi:hypothetical protein